MKNINITIDEDLYFKALPLVKERELSKTLNTLLRHFLAQGDEEVREDLSDLEQKRDEMYSALSEINAKMTAIVQRREKDKKKKMEQLQQMGEAHRMNNPLRDKLK